MTETSSIQTASPLRPSRRPLPPTHAQVVAAEGAGAGRRLADQYEYLGCYADKRTDRLLWGRPYWSDDMNARVREHLHIIVTSKPYLIQQEYVAQIRAVWNRAFVNVFVCAQHERNNDHKFFSVLLSAASGCFSVLSEYFVSFLKRGREILSNAASGV